MTDSVTELSRRAHELEPEDRARLAEALLASLESSSNVDAAFDRVLSNRIADVRDGRVELLSSADVFAKVGRPTS